MRILLRFSLLSLILVCGLGATFFYRTPVVQAGHMVSAVTMSLTCGSVEFTGSTGIGTHDFEADRDNTGNGEENFVLEVLDGAGNTLLTFSDLNNVQAQDGDYFDPSYPFASAPKANPITAEWFSAAGNSQSKQLLLSATIDGCPLAKLGGAPGIPSGFVMHTIICNVPVYNQAGGTPVQGSNIILGQTWFVNPKPVDAPDGSSWTEIFTSGLINGFVPTVCVQ